MKILVVGGGGREHAICWKLSNEKDVEKIYCAPGNPGIAKVAECVNIGDSDIAELVKFAKEKEIDISQKKDKKVYTNLVVFIIKQLHNL